MDTNPSNSALAQGPLPIAVRRPSRLPWLALFATLAAGAPAGATVIPVSTLVDEPTTANGNCTLREALVAAQTNAAADLCPAGQAAAADVVVLPAGVLAWDGPHHTEMGTGGPLVLRGPVPPPNTPPTAQIEIDATSKGRFLRLLSGSRATLENLEIRHGDVIQDPAGDRFGGAILASGLSEVDLTLRNVRLDGNVAGFGGALFFETTSDCAGCSLVIERSVFATNLAAVDDLPATPRGGGAFLAIRGETSVWITDSRFQFNRVATAFGSNPAVGGGLYAELEDTANVRLYGVTFTGNSAAADSSGPGEAGGAYLAASGFAAFEIVDATFEHNSIDEPTAAGGLYRATALHLETSGETSFVVDRMKLLANDPGDVAVDLRVRHFSQLSSLLRNVLVAGGAGRGAQVDNGPGDLLLGHWTVADHAVQELRLDRGTGDLRLENSILYGAEDLNASGVPDIDTTNVIGFDPSFENAAAGDYRLKASSTAIDFGNADHASVARYDAGHGRRVVGVDTDAGAYEAGAVFSDDFESGDAGAWSAGQP